MKDRRKMSNNIQNATETTISAVSGKATYAGSATTLGGWAISNEIVALVGLVLAVLGFIVNLIFKIREDRRRVEAHELAKKRAAEADPHVKKFLEEIPGIVRSSRIQGFEHAHEGHLPPVNSSMGYGGTPHPSPKPSPAGDDEPQGQEKK